MNASVSTKIGRLCDVAVGFSHSVFAFALYFRCGQLPMGFVLYFLFFSNLG